MAEVAHRMMISWPALAPLFRHHHSPNSHNASRPETFLLTWRGTEGQPVLDPTSQCRPRDPRVRHVPLCAPTAVVGRE